MFEASKGWYSSVFPFGKIMNYATMGRFLPAICRPNHIVSTKFCGALLIFAAWLSAHGATVTRAAAAATGA